MSKIALVYHPGRRYLPGYHIPIKGAAAMNRKQKGLRLHPDTDALAKAICEKEGRSFARLIDVLIIERAALHGLVKAHDE